MKSLIRTIFIPVPPAHPPRFDEQDLYFLRVGLAIGFILGALIVGFIWWIS